MQLSYLRSAEPRLKLTQLDLPKNVHGYSYTRLIYICREIKQPSNVLPNSPGCATSGSSGGRSFDFPAMTHSHSLALHGTLHLMQSSAPLDLRNHVQ
jgi:hypothetical protein